MDARGREERVRGRKTEGRKVQVLNPEMCFKLSGLQTAEAG